MMGKVRRIRLLIRVVYVSRSFREMHNASLSERFETEERMHDSLSLPRALTLEDQLYFVSAGRSPGGTCVVLCDGQDAWRGLVTASSLTPPKRMDPDEFAGHLFIALTEEGEAQQFRLEGQEESLTLVWQAKPISVPISTPKLI